MSRKAFDIMEFMEVVSTSESVQDIQSFMAQNGYGHIPDKIKRHDGLYTYGKLVVACLKKPQHAIEKLDYFVLKGLGEPADLTVAQLARALQMGGFFGEPTDDELGLLKSVVRWCDRQGWHFHDCSERDIKVIVTLFVRDAAFLEDLERMGVDFGVCKDFGNDDVASLVKAEGFSTLDFLSSRGLSITKALKIKSYWTREVVDYLVSIQAPILLEEFDKNCGLDIYSYAATKSGLVCNDKTALWKNVLNNCRLDIADFLVAEGVDSQGIDLLIWANDTEVIDWAIAHGLAPTISVYCRRDVLLYALQKGLRPKGILSINTKTHRRDGNSHVRFKDERAICEMHDPELIKAMLEAGYRDGADASSAIQSQNQELIDLYNSFGISGPLTWIARGDSFVKNGVARIPEGVVTIEDDAFEDVDISEIVLPSTLERIGERAFGGGLSHRTQIKEVRVPKSVTSLGLGAFYGIPRVYVYDNLYPDLKGAGEALDEINGEPNSNVGWVGISPFVGYSTCASNAYRSDYEIVVLSAETDEIKYRVEMPLKNAARGVYCLYASAWGRNASFDFSVADRMFAKLPYMDGKVKTALNRLLWPIELSDDARKTYEKYLVRNSKYLVKMLIDRDELESLKQVESLGLVKKSNVNDLIAYADESHNDRFKKYLECRKTEILQSARSSSSSKASRSKAGKKTPRVSLKRVKEGIEAGDFSNLAYFTVEQARKLKPQEANAFLDTVATACTPIEIDRLFELFGDFEFKTSALVCALNAGNLATARSLLSHGADLSNTIACLAPIEEDPDKVARSVGRLYTEGIKRLNMGNVKCLECVFTLVEEKAFSLNDLKMLLLLSVRDGNAEAAERLRREDALLGFGSIWFLSGPRKNNWTQAYSPQDFMTRYASYEVAKAACIADPQAINRCWDEKLVNSPIGKVAPRYLRESVAGQTVRKIVVHLAKEGETEMMKTVMNTWESARDSTTLKKAVAASSKAGSVELTAYLLDLQKRCG